LEAAAMGVCHMDGLICAVMDARRGQVYNALFHAKNGCLHRLTPDRVLTIDVLWTEIEALICGHNISSDHAQSPKHTILVGDGAQLCFGQKTGTTDAVLAPAHLRHPTAWAVAILAERANQRSETYPPSRLRPVYLRQSQAERERAEGKDR